jgi:PAS domain S-box-containing protein/putative nucleotidyltransferase with HDIG domain
MKRVSTKLKKKSANQTEGKRVISLDNAISEVELRYRLMFESAQDGILIVHAKTGKIEDANPYLLDLLGYSRSEMLRKKAWQLYVNPEAAKQTFEELHKKGTGRWDNLPLLAKNERVVTVECVSNVYYLGKRKIIQCNIRDITQRRREAGELQREKIFSEFTLNSLPGTFYLLDDQGRFLYWNKNFETVTGYQAQEIGQMGLSDLIYGDERELIEKHIEDVFTSGSSETEAYVISKNGSRIPYYFTGSRTRLDSQTCLIGVGMNITEHRHTERSLRNLSLAINASDDAVFMTDKDGIITSINPRFTELYGYTQVEVVGQTTPRILKSGIQSPEYYEQFWKTILQSQLIHGEVVNKSKDGKLVFIEETVNPFLDDHGNIAGFLAIQRNITERKQAEASVRRQLSHLKALREIDIAIASSFAMQINLSVLLKHTVTELGVDAASILLLNPDLNMLEYAAGYGFSTRAIEKSILRMDEGHAGHAAMQRVMVHIEDLRQNQHQFPRADLLAEEEFVSYFGVPLIAKGLVKGILETFHRSPLVPNQEWLDFLHTLAGQAAIAIEDAQLFRNLQQSNIELLQAYDATIEGWSRALDLRDKETEGHTQRVTDMAIILGRKLGLSDKELKYMRWGGLLHDIGKMAVPDRILLKPDALTFEEREIMKQHPSFALQMLSPIHYLKLALDIPYCHHEYWDGSGYPRGLKGEQIPLAARVFAIVDVYDALTSDRPYRTKWAEADVVKYIREHSGSFFDPKIVNVFLQMLEENQSM